MNVSYQALGSGQLVPNFSLTNGNNQVRTIYSNNSPSVSVSKGNFEYQANIPDVVTYNGSPNMPLNDIDGKVKSHVQSQIADRNLDAASSLVEFGCKSMAGFINSRSKNQYLDIINTDKAFGMAYSAVMKNNDAISDKFNNANWSSDFKNVISQGKIDIRNFKADIMNYMVDGNMNMDNFKLKGYGGDFNTYKNAVYQMGEQILNSSNLNFNAPQQNTTTNNLKDTYIYLGK